MDQRRRQFLRNAFATGTSVGAASLFTNANPLISSLAHAHSPTLLSAATGRWPILQAMTTESRAQFRILTDPTAEINVAALGPNQESLSIRFLDHFAYPSAHRGSIVHIEVLGLRAESDHRLLILDRSSGEVLDERFFRPLSTIKPSIRFALVSCMNDYHFSYAQSYMWQAVADAQPEIIFFLGDACYADVNSNGSEEDIWRRFLETRQTLDVFRWKRLIPILATWDDHDFGVNNGDSSYSKKFTVKGLFESMFRSEPDYCLEHGPGVSSLLKLSGQRFFLMDDRFFRSPPEQAQETHWGFEQEEWLFAKLAESSQPAWLFNGSQFFGGYLKKDSFERQHPRHFRHVLRRLAQMHAPVVLASGDVHFSEVMEIEPSLLGYKTFELTSSSIHSFTFPGHQYQARNRRRLTSTSKHNFLLVESRATEHGGLSAKVQARGADSIPFSLDLQVNR